MRTAGKGDVAVGIDHAGDDCGSTRIDDVDTRREIALIRAGTNPDHAACVGEKAHSCPQRWPVGSASAASRYKVGRGEIIEPPRASSAQPRRSKIVSPNQTNGGAGWGPSPLARKARNRGARACSSWAS